MSPWVITLRPRAMGQWLMWVIKIVSAIPSPVPRIPPMMPMAVPSTINSQKIDLREAPIALRRAISAKRC